MRSCMSMKLADPIPKPSSPANPPTEPSPNGVLLTDGVGAVPLPVVELVLSVGAAVGSVTYKHVKMYSW